MENNFYKVFNKIIQESLIKPGQLVFTRISDDNKYMWTITMEYDHYMIDLAGTKKRFIIKDKEIHKNRRVEFSREDPGDIIGARLEAKKIVLNSLDLYNYKNKLSLDVEI